ncbi:hypothetical protein HPB47_022183 [Ixodes persulcatus]|uniref:Uncharacterized protein n=1 Tax=Ixodes persulcatus TaxID=34615 RepID=A0AC60QAF6_IXOPE|nr:hypothetical protein HPB47_022183 [Ixodes persulcatus]
MAGTMCLVWIPHADVKRKCQLESPTLRGLMDAIGACSVLSCHVKLDVDRFQRGFTVVNRSARVKLHRFAPVRSEKTLRFWGGHLIPPLLIFKPRGYPSKKFYFKAVNLLLMQYPELSDVTGSGYESWTISLRNKFRNERRKVTGNAVVDDYRLKYGAQSRKRTAVEDCTGADVTTERPQKRLTRVALPVEGEDENSLEAHQQWLCAEARKLTPDEGQIDLRMDVTARKRLQALTSIPVETAQNSYPYLMDARRFQKDFERQTGIEPVKAMSEGVASVISLASRKVLKCSKELLEHITVDLVEDASSKLMKHKLAVAALQIICSNVKEPAAFKLIFVNEDEGTIPTTPCIVFSGHDVETAKSMSLYVDSVRLFEVEDAEAGLTAVMAAYWLFGIAYNQKTFNTSCLLEKLCFNLTYSRLRPVAIKVINAIKKIPVACHDRFVA